MSLLKLCCLHLSVSIFLSKSSPRHQSTEVDALWQRLIELQLLTTMRRTMERTQSTAITPPHEQLDYRHSSKTEKWRQKCERDLFFCLYLSVRI